MDGGIAQQHSPAWFRIAVKWVAMNRAAVRGIPAFSFQGLGGRLGMLFWEFEVVSFVDPAKSL